MEQEHKLELVEWTDANFSLDASNLENRVEDDYIVATVGWVEERGSWLLIVGEITPEGERCITRVPLINVVRRRRLKIKTLKPSS